MKEPLQLIAEYTDYCAICDAFTTHKKFSTRSNTLTMVHCTCGYSYVEDQENWEGKGYDIVQDMR